MQPYPSHAKGEGERGKGDAEFLRWNAEKLSGLAHCGDEGVDVVDVIIDVEGCARGRRDAQATHQRLSAVVAGPNTDAVLVQDRRQVVRMNVAVCERNDAGTVALRSIDRDALDLRQAFDRQARELVRVRRRLAAAELLAVADGGPRTHGTLHAGSPAV